MPLGYWEGIEGKVTSEVKNTIVATTGEGTNLGAMCKDFPDWGYDVKNNTVYRFLSVAFENQPKYDDHVMLVALKSYTKKEENINKRYMELLDTHI